MELHEVKKPKLYSTQEVADFMGISYERVYRLIRSGKINASNISGKDGKKIYRIAADDVQAYYDSLQKITDNGATGKGHPESDQRLPVPPSDLSLPEQLGGNDGYAQG